MPFHEQHRSFASYKNPPKPQGGPEIELQSREQCRCKAVVVSKDLATVWVQISVVMKFGGSSLASAERMQEVAGIICSFPEHYPCIVLSAMGKVNASDAPIDPPCFPGLWQQK